MDLYELTNMYGLMYDVIRNSHGRSKPNVPIPQTAPSITRSGAGNVESRALSALAHQFEQEQRLHDVDVGQSR